MGDLADLTLTVYLPENQYGQVHLGDQARVTVDSFAGQTYLGTVQFIAEEAQFTPHNVQTQSGRATTVFAIKLAVANPQDQLKPGMPADVAFAK